MRIKYTMLFDFRSNLTGIALGGRQGGWSESMYGGSGISTPDIAAFTAIMNLRANLLPSGARIVGQRYQPVDPVGGSTTGKIALPGATGLESDRPETCLFTRAASVGTPNQGRITLRGIPDDCVRQGEFRPVPGFLTAANTYLTSLGLAPAFFFKARNLQAAQAEIEFIDDNGIYRLTGDIALNPNDMVRVLRSTEDVTKARFGGVFRVSAVSTSRTGTLANFPNINVSGGRLRLEEQIYCQFAGPATYAGNIPEWTVSGRKVGSPFFRYRGKASRRR